MNLSSITEFILISLAQDPNQQVPLFVLFYTIYMVTLLGNSLIIYVINIDPQLHTPMYFFLGNLSFIDICLSSITVPLMLANLFLEKKAISFKGCMTQLFFLICTVCMEFFVLAIMAYDRLVAISNPLHYLMIMDKKTCVALIGSTWSFTFFHSLLYTCLVSAMSFCGPNKIHEHFCDLTPILALSCSDTASYDLLIFTEGSLVTMIPFVFVVVSYIRILKTILMIPSTSGRHRAFSTCSSHLTSVGLYFGTIFATYFHSSSSASVVEDRAVTIIYSVLTPLLNPFIYSLRNQQVKGALKKNLCWTLSQ